MRMPGQRNAAIEATVTKQAREQTLLELEGGLSVEVVGGGAARIDRVSVTELRDVQERVGGGFTAVTAWTGRGRAGHWGHAHQRDVVFEGLVDLASEGSFWKIDGLTVIKKTIPD